MHRLLSRCTLALLFFPLSSELLSQAASRGSTLLFVQKTCLALAQGGAGVDGPAEHGGWASMVPDPPRALKREPALFLPLTPSQYLETSWAAVGDKEAKRLLSVLLEWI